MIEFTPEQDSPDEEEVRSLEPLLAELAPEDWEDEANYRTNS